MAFAATPQHAYVVVSRCGWFEGLCSHPFTFWRSSSLTSDTWDLVLHLPASTHADIAALGSTVYVLDSTVENQPGPDPFYASADGVHFTSRPDPCDTSNFVSLVQAVPVSASAVYLACVGPLGELRGEKQVFRSDDRGATTRAVGALPEEGTTADLAVSTSGALVLASVGEQSYLFADPGRAKNWTTVVNRTDGGLGWNDIVYSSASTAWVVYAPYEESSAQIGQLWRSPDGGDHWEVANL